MFDLFRTAFPVGAPSSRKVSEDSLLTQVTGYLDFASEFAGATFRDGLYRVHDSSSATSASKAVADVFPEARGRIELFGYDWLGRQFGLDFARVVDGDPLVMMMNHTTGEMLEIPCTFTTFHDDELVNDADAALAAAFFDDWAETSREVLPLGRDQCVGYKVPLFLGGSGDVDNLELTDISVDWAIAGQVLQSVRGLAPGTKVRSVRIAGRKPWRRGRGRG